MIYKVAITIMAVFAILGNVVNAGVYTVFAQEEASTDALKTAIDKLGEEFPADEAITIQNLERVKNALLFQFDTKADDAAMTDVVRRETELTPYIIANYYTPLLQKYRQDRGLPLYSQMSEEQKKEFDAYIVVAKKEAIRMANANATNNDEFEALSMEAKAEFSPIIERLLLSEPGLTIERLKQDIPALYRGLFFLTQQYGFENGLVEALIFNPEKLKGILPSTTTPYSRLKRYGGTGYNFRVGFLSLNERLFEDRIKPVTGFSNIEEMVEKIAQKHGLSVEEYYKKETEALLAQTQGQDIYRTIKENKHSWYLPILARGKGTYVAASENAITIGMLATYRDLIKDPNLLMKKKGSAQPDTPFFMDVLRGFDNYMQFMKTVKKKDVPFVTVLDSMNHKYETNPRNIGEWSKPRGVEAAEAVRNFFSPMNLYSEYKKSGVGIGGESNGPTALKAFETRLLHPNMQGVGLFTHEMTHGNDEEALYNGIHGDHGRRNGQGPEIYARGLFEAIDNSQKTSDYFPVFNLNTAIPIGDKEDRVQASEALNSKDKLETYFKNLMDLVAYLEAKEAEAAIAVLNDHEKATYFNRVSQVVPTKMNNIGTAFENDANRIEAKSTNDRYAPFGKLDNPELSSVTGIADLVKQDAVSGQFIPNGRTPLMPNLQSNQYDSVPLLESYYAASVATAGNNTVGDVSFKRHAYEILGWKGWDAFVKYVSDAHPTDEEAFTDILGGEAPDWEAYKIQKYTSLSEMKPVEKLWDEDDLMERLKVAVKQDLVHMQALRRNADPILEHYTDTPTNRNQLTFAATNIAFAKNATNVRNVKLDILRAALKYNDLKATVLKNDDNFSVRYEFRYEGSTEANFDQAAAPLPSEKKVNINTVENAPADYTDILTSKDSAGEWKFNGWDKKSVTVTEETVFTGTWKYQDYEKIEIIETINDDPNLPNGQREVDDQGEIGLRSPFTKEVVREMRPRIVRVGSKNVLNRQPAIDAVNTKADQKKKEINDNASLTQEEKNVALAEVERQKTVAIEAINQAKDENEILAEQEKGEEKIGKIKPTPVKKPSALQAFEIEAEKKKNEVRLNNDLIDTEKATRLEKIAEIFATIQEAVRDAMNDAEVDVAKEDAIRALNEIDMTAVQKPNALDMIGMEADAKIVEITQNNELSDDEKQRLIDQVNAERGKSIAAVGQIVTEAELQNLLNAYEQKLEEIQPTTFIKAESKRAVEAAAEEKIKAIEAIADLTEEEKQKYKMEVNALKGDALKQIVMASTDAQVIAAKEQGIDSINRLVTSPQVKPAAIADITVAITAKKAEIDSIQDLTNEEKSDAKIALDQMSEGLLAQVNAQTTSLLVANAKQTALQAISDFSAEPMIKKNALAAIEKAAEDKKREIDSLLLENKEKENLKAKVNALVDKARRELPNVQANADVDQLKQATVSEILAIKAKTDEMKPPVNVPNEKDSNVKKSSETKKVTSSESSSSFVAVPNTASKGQINVLFSLLGFAISAVITLQWQLKKRK